MNDSSPATLLDQVYLLQKYDPDSRLQAYFKLLTRENLRCNLVSRETIDSGLERLAAESLAPLGFLDQNYFQNYLDIGSGGGFPSIPILFSGFVGKGCLVERTRKKAAALLRMTQSLRLSAKIIAESLEHSKLDRKFDLISIRLVKLTPRLLREASALLAEKGSIIYYSHPEFELDETSLSVERHNYAISNSAPPKSFAILKKLSAN